MTVTYYHNSLILILDSSFSMDANLFDEILEKAEPYILKQNTNMRDASSAHDRLCITLRFLASGQSYKDL